MAQVDGPAWYHGGGVPGRMGAAFPMSRALKNASCSYSQVGEAIARSGHL